MATEQQVAETKQMVRQAMQEEGVTPQTLIRLGSLAKAVLEDKSLYPQLLQEIIDSDLAESLQLSGLDFSPHGRNGPKYRYVFHLKRT